MEYVGQRSIKKLCNFYVSDLHLSVMLLPYLNKQLSEDVEITTIFEKLGKENLEIILDKLNIKNKKEILNINWLNSCIDTCQRIENTVEKSIEKNKQVTIIIGGDKKYILETNNKIMKIIGNSTSMSNIKIVNCYNIEEVGSEMESIVKEYDGILKTSGEVEISNA